MTTTGNPPARGTTPRGFAIYDQFTGRNGTTIRIQESSLATETCVWVFCQAACGDDTPLHLPVADATRLRDALDAFITEHAATIESETAS